MQKKLPVKDGIVVNIRYYDGQDVPQMMEIEKLSFGLPWTEEELRRSLHLRNSICILAEKYYGIKHQKLLGFMIYQLHEKSIHLLNLAIHPDVRREGIARQMIHKIKTRLLNDRRRHIVAEVRETNLPIQLFFKSQGFKATEVLRGYYKDSGEDAFRMEYQLDGFEEAANCTV